MSAVNPFVTGKFVINSAKASLEKELLNRYAKFDICGVFITTFLLFVRMMSLQEEEMPVLMASWLARSICSTFLRWSSLRWMASKRMNSMNWMGRGVVD